MSKKVGILGGGQLSQMLAEAARNLGLHVIAFVDTPDDPATQVAHEFVVGKVWDRKAVEAFLGSVEAVVFESEFIPCENLEGLSDAKLFHPDLSCLRRFRDKLNQKTALKEAGIPAVPYVVYEDGDIGQWLKRLRVQFSQGVVLKWAQWGYDGKGVLQLREDGEAIAFCERAKAKRIRIYGEKRVDFRRELAIIGCLSVTGQFVAYPLVVSEQWEGICLRVTGPATGLGVFPAHEKSARQFAETLARKNDLVGCFALELFETKDGSLLVNEIAPRVHNSGHVTQDAMLTSQFENHWRAVLGFPLGDTTSSDAFVMRNILGPDGVTCLNREISPPVPPIDTKLHWYGKVDIRPRRKLGHLNASAPTIAALPKIVEALEKAVVQWEKTLDGKKR